MRGRPARRAGATALLGAALLAAGCTDEPGREPSAQDSPTSTSGQPTSETSGGSGTPDVDSSSDEHAQRAADSVRRCFGRRVTQLGTRGDDQLRGTRSRDTIVTLGGDDAVAGLHGEDRLCAGPGQDRVTDVNGYGVRVSLGDGHDTVEVVTLGWFLAGRGDDTVLVTLRSVTSLTAHLGPGDDRLRVRPDPTRPPPRYGEVCLGLAHAERPVRVDLARGVVTGQGRDRISGVRCVHGGPAPARVIGSPGSDYLEATRGPLHARTGAGRDFVNGSSVADEVRLGPGDDAFHGYHGADRGWGGSGADFLTGDNGTDVLHGGAGDDELGGGTFCYDPYGDPLRADGSPNRLHGGPGKDHLVGDIGNDFLHGGPGHDRGFGQDDGLLDTLVSLERPSSCR